MYLDDSIINFQNAEKHILHVCTVLSLFIEVGIPLNLKKSGFSLETSHYSRHATWLGKLEMSDHTTDETSDLKPPCNVSKLKSIL